MTNEYLVNTAGNHDLIDDGMSLANQKRRFEQALVELAGQWSGVHDFVKTVENGQPIKLNDFYWVRVPTSGIKNKEVYQLRELPSEYNEACYELYGPYGEIDSNGAVRTYGFNPSRMRNLKFSY